MDIITEQESVNDLGQGADHRAPSPEKTGALTNGSSSENTGQTGEDEPKTKETVDHVNGTQEATNDTSSEKPDGDDETLRHSPEVLQYKETVVEEGNTNAMQTETQMEEVCKVEDTQEMATVQTLEIREDEAKSGSLADDTQAETTYDDNIEEVGGDSEVNIAEETAPETQNNSEKIIELEPEAEEKREGALGQNGNMIDESEVTAETAKETTEDETITNENEHQTTEGGDVAPEEESLTLEKDENQHVNDAGTPAEESEEMAETEEAQTYLINQEAEKQVMHELIDETVVLEKDVNDLQTKLEQIETQKSDFESKIDRLTTENESQKIEIKNLEAELEDVKKGDGEERAALEESMQRVRDLEEQLKRLVKDDEAKSKKLIQVEKELENLAQKYQALQQEARSAEPPKSKTCVIM